ncbi:MAG TPA: hypothetical protein PLM77_18850, partial [Phycisphaerae bacterium]|nr:hypothetical protein [Phycisphaerae bacterium]
NQVRLQLFALAYNLGNFLLYSSLGGVEVEREQALRRGGFYLSSMCAAHGAAGMCALIIRSA